jgi:hypothetical protein
MLLKPYLRVEGITVHMQHHALHSTTAAAVVAIVPAAAGNATMVASAPGPIVTSSHRIVTAATST